MDDATQDYVDAMAPEYRPLFDRLHRLVMLEYPEAVVALSYRMPSYRVGRRRLYVGVWKHGVSLYGWGQDRGAAFLARHQDLRTSKGTIQLRPDDAAAVPDEDFRELIRAALSA
jgi:uncharacterized protein YdhG (YjbR/CyaY superfamily)